MIKEVIPIPIIPNDKSGDRSLTQALAPHRPRRAEWGGGGVEGGRECSAEDISDLRMQLRNLLHLPHNKRDTKKKKERKEKKELHPSLKIHYPV